MDTRHVHVRAVTIMFTLGHNIHALSEDDSVEVHEPLIL